MSTINIKPTTLVGIKRLANSIKKEQGISHAQALNSSAIQSGFENFKHAQNALESTTQQPPENIVYLTRSWKDKKTGEKGIELLTVLLDEPWGNFVTAAQLKFNRGLGDFYAGIPDHFDHRYLADSQSSARQSLCVAARNLQFMNATKLRPNNSFRIYPKGSPRYAVPGQDHYSGWYDSKSKRYLFVDEPYAAAVANMKSEREIWAKLYNQEVALSPWAGMYNPDGGSRMFLISDKNKGVPIKPLLEVLTQLPPPITLDNWNGESRPYLPMFFSPGALEKDRITRAKIEDALARRKANKLTK
jgi:hypothetical protein